MTPTPKADVEIFCFDCKAKRLGDPQTGRCRTCGKVQMASSGIAEEFGHPMLDGTGVARHSPSAAYRSTASAAVVSPLPATEPAAVESSAEAATQMERYFEQPSLAFVLPDSRETTSWLAKTRAVRDQLLARADKAEAQALELGAEATRCRQTAASFTSLLGQLSVAGSRDVSASAPTTDAPAASTATTKARSKWSRDFAACRDCGRSDLPHCANGRCRSCDGRWRSASSGARR